MRHQKVVARRVGRLSCAVGRAAGAVVEGLEARYLLSAVLFVDDSAVGSGDGSSWDNAFTDLQAALGQAVYGDEIRIAAGTYRPTATADRTISFELQDGVSLLGGYAGYGADDPDAHNVALYPTVLSGDIGVAGESTDNSYHVISSYGVSSTTLVDGVTITAGYADGSSTDSCGGGMYNGCSSSPTLTNCTFSGNMASSSGSDGSYGGGMYNGSSSPTLTDCTFSGNTASDSGSGGSYGGGMYNSSSSPALTGCIFIGNMTVSSGSVGSSGGAMYNYGSSSPTLTDCTFSGNTASSSGGGGSYGGGMLNTSSSPALTNCTFSGNTANNGAGMYNYCSSSPTLTNCTFSGNTASGSSSDGSYGGGMLNYSSSPTLTGCTFSGNTASTIGDVSSYGGGMYNHSSSPILTNCTFSGNTTSTSGSESSYGGGMFNYSSSPSLTNCAFSGNTANSSGSVGSYGGGIFNYSSSPTLANCTFSGNTGRSHGASSGYGGWMYNNTSSPTLTNCIAWDNGNRPIGADDLAESVITYSDIQGGYEGSHNINADPLFVRSPSVGPDGVWGTADDDYGDLRLQLSSPCINAGNNEALGLVGSTTDLAGNPRIIAGMVDLGAYEAEVVAHGLGTFGAKHSLTLIEADGDTVKLAIGGGGEGTLLSDYTIALTGTTAKSVLTITVKKGRGGGDGLLHLSGIASDGPLKAINASAVFLSGQVQINTQNQDAGKASISLKFRTISDADVRVQEMPVSAFTVGGMVSDSRIVATGSIGKFSAAALVDSDILVGVATDFAGQFAGHDDFINSTAKLGSLTVTGQKLPKGSSYPAYVSGVHVSAPSIGMLKLANVDSTAGAVQAHVLADTGTLTVTARNPVMGGVSVLTAGSWKPGKAGRPRIWEVV